MAEDDRIHIQTNCGFCGGTIRVDVTNFANNFTIENIYRCENGHEYTVSIRNQEFLDLTPRTRHSDIDDYDAVPEHIKDIIKEAYECASWELTIAGACVVRRLLDEVLFHNSYQQRYVGEKVTQLQRDCRQQAYRDAHPSLCGRRGVFRTISDLAGFVAHAQGYQPIEVPLGDFEMYLYAVESEVKTTWPRVN